MPKFPTPVSLLLSLAIGLVLASCSSGAGDGGAGDPMPTAGASVTGGSGGGNTAATAPTPTTPIASDDTSIPANQTTNAAGPDGTAPAGTGTQPAGNTNGTVGTAPDNTAVTTTTTPTAQPAGEPTWTPPTVLQQTPGTTTPSDVQLDASGNGIAVWSREGATDVLYAARYTASNRTWSAPIELSTTGTVAGFDLQVAANGNAILAWLGIASEVRSTHVRRFTPAGGWGPVETLDTATFGRPAAAIDNAGNAYVMFDHIDAAFANSYFGRAATTGGAFGAPEAVAPPTTRLRVSDLAIANGARSALFLYDATPMGQAPGDAHVFSTRYTGGAWLALERFDDEAGHVPAARLVMNTAGNARGYWVTTSAVKHRYAAAGGAFGPVESIAYTNAGYRRSIGMNVAGDALFAASDPRGVFVSRYRVGQGWGPFVPVFQRSGFTGTLQAPRLNENGDAALSWMHGDRAGDGVDYSTYHLWASALH